MGTLNFLFTLDVDVSGEYYISFRAGGQSGKRNSLEAFQKLEGSRKVKCM